MDSRIRLLLKQTLADVLEIQVDAVQDDLPFRDQGVSSAQVLTLIACLSERLNRTIPLAAAWEHPSVAALSAHLSAEVTGTRSSMPAANARQTDEPVAIVGMGCRFPGGIHDPSTFWQALLEGLDAIREVPSDRWDLAKWFDTDPQAPGKMSTRWGGFIEDVAGFDAGFFQISPKEAAHMDPQQRLALEVSWEALEDAGIVPETLDGSRTGVFVGAWGQDYAELAAAADSQQIEQHSATGRNNSVIPARIAYALGLRGPVLTVNTACSSSLVAVHLAVQSLRSGESELALVSGVNLMLAPHTTVQMSKFGAMSPSGRCRSFDSEADGYVRGEGCGAIVLRPLSDALRNGERIYALIRASAVNNDGASNGLAAPNPEAQREVLAEAWRQAGLPAHEVSYVEAHGTGTPLGDPIEASALAATFGQGRTEPLRIGSIKTNFGHLEGAAGMAGLMKAALALHHGELPASLHFKTPNPRIPFTEWKLKVVDARETFPGESLRSAGVSSFGYGGTNGHVALSELPYRRRNLLPLAADTEAELAQLAQRSCEQLSFAQGSHLFEALTAQPGAGRVRAVVTGRHPSTLAHALQELADLRAACPAGPIPESAQVVFVFSGHGGQWLGMGRELLASEPTFARVLRECDRLIQAESGWSVISELCAREDGSHLGYTEVVQPVLYALQLATARMLQSWGIKPSALLGQSIGEVAAAVIGGALSEQAGAKLIVRWSALVERRAARLGAMVVAALTRRQAEAWLERARTLGIAQAALSISAQLAPHSVSFAGTNEAIFALERAMRAEHVRVYPVNIDYACHSPLMRPLASELTELLRDLTPTGLQIPMWSTVHARFVRGRELTAAYWAENLERPIALQQGIETLSSDAVHFVEIGPHPITLRSIEDTLGAAGSSAVALATGYRAQPVWPVLEQLVTSLWQRGIPLDWQAFRGHAPQGVADQSCAYADPRASAPMPLLLSARTEAALRAQAGRWANWLAQHPETPWADIVYTAALHRTHFPQRAAITVLDGAEAVEALHALAEGRAHPRVLDGTARPCGSAVFVFPGQGSQWPGMGRALLEESTVFAQAAADCDTALRPYTGWSVLSVLRGDQGEGCPPSERVDVIQPALFTMNVALAALWQSLGVQPSAVLGHSQGEIAAAVVAGALSLEDGARIVALRSQLLGRIAGSGAMATTELPYAAVVQRLRDERWSDLYVAVVNTTTSTVVAGTAERVAAWITAISEAGIFCRRVAVDYASHTPHVDAILGELKEALATLTPRKAEIAMISTVTGEPISGLSLDADYWCRNLREPVRLDLALAHLRGSRRNVFIEASAHPVLSMALSAESDLPGAVVGSLRRDAGGLRMLYANLAALHVAGFAVDCALLASRGSLAALPTYAFRHQSYWLPRPVSRSDVKAAGLSSVKHPLLASLTSLAESERLLLTGRVCLSEQPWLSHHGVFGTVLAPGTCLLELSLCAARAVGSASVSELTLAAPLLLPLQHALRLQVHVEAPDPRGARTLAIFSRPESAGEDQPWTQHATGALLSEALSDHSTLQQGAWPPVGAEPLDLVDAYKNLAEVGYDYGESFQCLRAAWRAGAEIFAHVALPPDLARQAADYGVHPALLDAALHAFLIAERVDDGSSLLWLPFAWSEVSQYALGASELRVRLTLQSDDDETRTLSLLALDARGQTVLRASALRFRQASAEQVRGSVRSNAQDLYRVSFRLITPNDLASRFCVLGSSSLLADVLGVQRFFDVSALFAALDGQTPATLVVDLTASCQALDMELPSDELASAIQAGTGRVLAQLQQLLLEPRLSSTSLVWVTQRALATGAEDDGALNLVAAPIWGLLRSARSENPERSLRLIDLDHELPTSRMFQRLVATISEPELALRDGNVLVPRLARVRERGEQRRPDSWGTVLITGGLGELGRSLAQHLVEQHGVKHLVLTSRRGLATPGAHELVLALQRAGAKTVMVAACDVAVRSELEALIDGIPLNRALCGVFHLAGVLHDSIASRLTEEQLRAVLEPKLAGALHLHELTQAHPISTFVMFSSVASVLGFQGQANYAAANAFLDALAAERRRVGLPAQSLAWGLWEQQGIGMSAHLGKADIARMARQGVAPLPLKSGFALLDSALSLSDATLTPARLDLSSFAEEAELVPVMLRALVHRAPRVAAARTSSGAVGLLARLAALPETERQGALLSAVRDESASVLGLTSLEVRVDQPLRAQGLDSLMAVELRNRLTRRFELALPSTLAFDYPTPSAIAGLLHERLKLEQAPRWSDADIRGKLERLSIAALRDSGVLDMLMLQPEQDRPERSSVIARKTEDVDIETLERESLLDMMERMLGDV